MPSSFKPAIITKGCVGYCEPYPNTKKYIDLRLGQGVYTNGGVNKALKDKLKPGDGLGRQQVYLIDDIWSNYPVVNDYAGASASSKIRATCFISPENMKDC